MTSQNDEHYKLLRDQDESKREAYKKSMWGCVLVIVLAVIVVAGYFSDNNSNSNNNNNNNNNDVSDDKSKTSANKYYVVVNKSLKYSDANEYCSSMYGTSLTTIFDMYQNNIAKDLCTWPNSNGNNDNSSTSGDGCWIGYTKSDTLLSNSDYIVESVNGKGWFWLWYNTTNKKIDWTSSLDIFTLNDTNNDESTLRNNFTNWNGDYQTIEQNTECAMLLSKNGTWLSQACNKRYPFVCNYYLEVESLVFRIKQHAHKLVIKILRFICQTVVFCCFSHQEFSHRKKFPQNCFDESNTKLHFWQINPSILITNVYLVLKKKKKSPMLVIVWGCNRAILRKTFVFNF